MNSIPQLCPILSRYGATSAGVLSSTSRRVLMFIPSAEQMVKFPKKLFEKMISRYRVAGTFENLNRKYEAELSAKQDKNKKLTEQIDTLKAKIKQHTGFLGKRGLLESFAEFIRPKTLRERLKINKEKADINNSRSKVRIIDRNRRNDMAI